MTNLEKWKDIILSQKSNNKNTSLWWSSEDESKHAWLTASGELGITIGDETRFGSIDEWFALYEESRSSKRKVKVKLKDLKKRKRKITIRE